MVRPWIGIACTGLLLASTLGLRARTGTVIVLVRSAGGTAVERITVSVTPARGRARSNITNADGLVAFAELPAGRLILATSDSNGWKRTHGAFIGFGPDTIVLSSGATVYDTLLVSQRVPPALYR